MSAPLEDPKTFATLLQRFFLDRLMQQQNASPQTVAAYRDTFRLLLAYLLKTQGRSPSVITLADFNPDTVLAFLAHLETERHNCARTRNCRLAALRAFAQYVGLQCPAVLPQIQQILAIPAKRYDRPLLGFLARDELQAMLAVPDVATWIGSRDRLMLALLYNTGARVLELIGIRVSDVNLVSEPSVRLRGKGWKDRLVPLWRETVTDIRAWLKRAALHSHQPLLPNRHGSPMSRTNVAERIHCTVTGACPMCPQLNHKRISPHTIRQTTAMHLLQSGVDITVIALWLGHESPATTHFYIEADLAMKEKALSSVTPPAHGRKRYQPKEGLLKFLEGL